MAWRSCSVLCRLTGGDPFLCSVRGGRWPGGFQQRCGFKKASRTPEPKQPEPKQPEPKQPEPKQPEPKQPEPKQLEGLELQKWGPLPSRVPGPQQPPAPHRAFSRLIRPFFFTVGFSGCSFGAAAIWQYESLKSRVQNYFDELQANWLEKLRPQKQGDLRKEINEWWNSLTEGQKTVAGIIFANILVFLAWPLVPPPIMVRYFTSNPASSSLCLPMLLSTFSHMSLFHLVANMYVLWSFSSSAVSMLGREQFLAVYLSAAVTSSFSSYLWKTATGRCVPSVGASGAIMAVLALVCTKMPEAKLAIIFLPMFTFTATNALKAIVVMDTAGLLLRWRFFDHAAHLGGALFGIWYILFGHELIWKNREPLVKLWHDLRTQSGGRPGGPGGAV